MKRRLLIIAILLLLGAVVNVAVAWGCAAWPPPLPFDDPPMSRLAAQRLWDRYALEGWSPFSRYESGTNWCSTGEMVWGPKPYRLGGIGAAFMVGQVRTGWPSRTFQHGWYYDGGEHFILNGWLTRPGQGARLEARSGRVLPYEPIWPGLTTNTLFYAAILWLLLLGPFALRRFLRLRRGLCPKCAYPMGESSVCPECGNPLPPMSRAAMARFSRSPTPRTSRLDTNAPLTAG